MLGRGETKERTSKVVLQICSWWAGGQAEKHANQRKGLKHPSKSNMLKQVVTALIFVHFCDLVFTIICLQTSRGWWKYILNRTVGAFWRPSLMLPALIALPVNLRGHNSMTYLKTKLLNITHYHLKKQHGVEIRCQYSVIREWITLWFKKRENKR